VGITLANIPQKFFDVLTEKIVITIVFLSMYPEFSRLQREVADSFLTTTVQGKASRVVLRPDGTHYIDSQTRPVHMIDFPKRPREFALKIHETRPTDPPSPYFVNFRNLPPEMLVQFGRLLEESPISFHVPDVCTGIPKAGVDIAKAYSLASGVPYLDIYSKEEHTDGTRRIIGREGTPDGNQKKLLIIDDLITRAGTKLEAIQVAREQGFNVTGVAVILDREQGGQEELTSFGVWLSTVFSIRSLLEYYCDTRQISQYRFDKIRRYLAAQE